MAKRYATGTPSVMTSISSTRHSFRANRSENRILQVAAQPEATTCSTCITLLLTVIRNNRPSEVLVFLQPCIDAATGQSDTS